MGRMCGWVSPRNGADLARVTQHLLNGPLSDCEAAAAPKRSRARGLPDYDDRSHASSSEPSAQTWTKSHSYGLKISLPSAQADFACAPSASSSSVARGPRSERWGYWPWEVTPSLGLRSTTMSPQTSPHAAALPSFKSAGLVADDARASAVGRGRACVRLAVATAHRCAPGPTGAGAWRTECGSVETAAGSRGLIGAELVLAAGTPAEPAAPSPAHGRAACHRGLTCLARREARGAVGASAHARLRRRAVNPMEIVGPALSTAAAELRVLPCVVRQGELTARASFIPVGVDAAEQLSTAGTAQAAVTWVCEAGLLEPPDKQRCASDGRREAWDSALSTSPCERKAEADAAPPPASLTRGAAFAYSAYTAAHQFRVASSCAERSFCAPNLRRPPTSACGPAGASGRRRHGARFARSGPP